MRIGIFGGTFDPIHNAHLFVAEAARVLEGLDQVLFVPTRATHYRSAAIASVEERCAMIAAAIAGNPRFALDRTDLAEDASGYTADLLPRLRARYGDADFTLVIGADSLASGTWVRLDEILRELEQFAVAPRAGVNEMALSRAVGAMPADLRNRVKTLNLPEIPESSTLVRKLLADGKTVRYLVPEPVWRYIDEHGLYGATHDVA